MYKSNRSHVYISEHVSELNDTQTSYSVFHMEMHSLAQTLLLYDRLCCGDDAQIALFNFDS